MILFVKEKKLDYFLDIQYDDNLTSILEYHNLRGMLDSTSSKKGGYIP